MSEPHFLISSFYAFLEHVSVLKMCYLKILTLDSVANQCKITLGNARSFFMGISFLSWQFVTQVTDKYLARKSLDFTVPAIAFVLHTIINYLPSCKKPLGA